MNKTCFSIMPFKKSLNDIDAIIEQAAQDCGLDYLRGDHHSRPGRIMTQILQDIRDAGVVVADITDHNPNVYYELGIAHQLLGPERVVILSQSEKDHPFDVHEFRTLVYEHNEEGRKELRRRLPVFLREALESNHDEERWSVVRGQLQRTHLIVRDLTRELERFETGKAEGLVIRVAAGLGSLAISDHEPEDPRMEPEYHEQLLAERNALRALLLRGAEVRAVINPPRRFARAMLPERLQARYRRLIGLLEGRSDILDDPQAACDDVAMMARCRFTLSPVPMPNLFIIGDEVAYEGLKRGGGGGFDKTHIETDPRQLAEMIRQFDEHFAASLADMRRTHPPDGQLLEQLKAFHAEAMAQAGAWKLPADTLVARTR